MIFFVARILVWLFKVDMQKAQRIAIFVLAGLGLIVVIVLGLWLKACLTNPPKLDEKAIQEAQTAIKERNDAELKRILVESDVKEKAIDESLANAEAEKLKAIKESKDKWASASTDELAAELERRANQ